jgi:acetylornithine deacetylase/succinyl-diaminopimelate desuccinylase family protein
MSSSQLLHDLVQQKFREQTAFLAELVKVPSDNPPGDCQAHALRAKDLLEQLGFEVESHRVPDDIVRQNGMISATNLVVRHRFGDGPVIALNAHGDVVAPGLGWTHDPYGAEIKDGMMFGRGVAVSKSDFATYAFALLALKASKLPLRGSVELHLTYDEEQGGEIGPGWLLSQNISKPDAVICAGFSYAVVSAHNGCLHLEVEVRGKSAHAAIPFTGIDAMEAANHIMSGLYDYRSHLSKKVSAVKGIGSPQLNIGLIEGGINTNVVPDRVTFRLDRRIIPDETPENVEAEVREVIAAAAARSPAAKVNVKRILLARPLKPTAATDALAALVCKNASAVFGETITSNGVPLYTDARLYAERNIPVVLYGAGPRTIEEANGHRADERLKLDDLQKATEVLALTLRDYLS